MKIFACLALVVSFSALAQTPGLSERIITAKPLGIYSGADCQVEISEPQPGQVVVKIETPERTETMSINDETEGQRIIEDESTEDVLRVTVFKKLRVIQRITISPEGVRVSNLRRGVSGRLNSDRSTVCKI